MRKKHLAFLYIGYSTGLVYEREHIGQAGTEKHGDDCYIGLILKCNEIKEKIRHLRRGIETFVSTWEKKIGICSRCIPSGPVPSSRIHAALLGLRYLGYRPVNQFLLSGLKE